jgi:DNA-binding NtrC family response regulator
MIDTHNAPPGPSGAEMAGDADARGGTPHLLVVDDERVVCDALARHLREEGYVVTTAYSGTAAIDLIGTMHFELALIDIRMPRVTGHDVLDALKATSPGTPVVMMTSYADIRSAVELISRGASDILSKPVDIDEVIMTVRRCLSART